MAKIYFVVTLFLGSGMVALAQSPSVTAFSPARNAVAAPRASAVALTFSQPLNAATAAGVRVFSAQSGGQRAAAVSASGSVLTARPLRGFRPGEVVSVSVPATVTGASGAAAVPTVYQFTAAAGVASASFTTGSNVTVSAGSSGVVIPVDVDDDGDLDLLAPVATRAVSLNDGRGNFTPTTNASLSGGSYWSTADLDGDGDVDFIASDGQSSVFTFFNNGSGAFSAGPVLTGSYGYSSGVATGDVDGDGDQDVLIGTYYMGTPGPGAPSFNTVSIFLNRGTGTFAPSFTATVGTNVTDLVLGDLDSDGDLDLVANSQYNGLAVRINDGTGHFSGSQNLTMGTRPVLADIDADGDLDLLSVNGTAGTVSVSRNNGSGTFGASTAVLVDFGPTRLAVADVDGDGDLDLLTVNSNNGGYSCSIRLNNGSGTFSGGSDPSLPLDPTSLVMGDMDGDGDLDAVISGYNSPTVRLQLNGGTGAALATAPAAGAVGPDVFPNPAHEKATLRLSAGTTALPVALTDVMGREVRHYPAGTTPEITLDLHGLPAGVYVLRSGAWRQRLVIE